MQILCFSFDEATHLAHCYQGFIKLSYVELCPLPFQGDSTKQWPDAIILRNKD
jgi:hypothetical protein